MKKIFLALALGLFLAVPQNAPANTAAQSSTDQLIIVGGPYYYGSYWYPPYYYFHYHPYSRPTGEWKMVEQNVATLEKNVDDLKDIADDVEEQTNARADKQIEENVKQLDKAVDALHNEFRAYGVYSKSYINELYENIMFHNDVLATALQSRGGPVGEAYQSTSTLLSNLRESYGRVKP